MDPLGGVWTSDAGTFYQKYVKMKELGPVGGRAPGTPPRSANALLLILHLAYLSSSCDRSSRVHIAQITSL